MNIQKKNNASKGNENKVEKKEENEGPQKGSLIERLKRVTKKRWIRSFFSVTCLMIQWRRLKRCS